MVTRQVRHAFKNPDMPMSTAERHTDHGGCEGKGACSNPVAVTLRAAACIGARPGVERCDGLARRKIESGCLDVCIQATNEWAGGLGRIDAAKQVVSSVSEEYLHEQVNVSGH